LRVSLPGSRHAFAPKLPRLLLFAIVTRIFEEGPPMQRLETAILLGLYALLTPLIIALALH
jgi:hypothetical protein